MYKIRSKSSKQILAMIICLSSICFGYTSAQTLNSLFDDILKWSEQSKPIDQIFGGETTVENLYSKSLKLIKSQNVTILKDGIQELTQIISQTSQSSVKQQDVMNILYDTNVAATKFAGAMNTLTKRAGTRQIPEEQVNASYMRLSKKIPACVNVATRSGINSISQEERLCIKKRVGTQYANLEHSSNDLVVFKLDNYGEDFYTNGTTDDSEYDLLIDIQKIGDLLFTSFIGPTETLFYKMPTSKSSNINNTLSQMAGIIGANNQTINDISGGTNTSGEATSGTNNTNGTNTNNTSSNTNNNQGQNNQNTKEDAELETFIKTSTTQSTTSSSTTTNNKVNVLGAAEGNMCIPSVSAGNSNTQTNSLTTTITTTEITTIEKYLDELDKETNSTTPSSDYTPTPTIEGNYDDMSASEITAMNQLIEDKIDNIFDEKSTKACTDKCTVGTLSEQTMCKIECLCFSIQYPKTGLVGLDGQLKVRFCTIPVEKNRVSKQKDVLGRDDSLSRIKSVFENLLNGGEMIKYERPQEYLDSSLGAIKRAKYISFEIKVYIKSLFGTVDNKARQINANKKAEENNQKIKGSIGKGDIDRDRYKLSEKENIITSTNLKKTDEELAKIVQSAKNQKSIKFNEKVSKFLEENSNFWFSIKEQMVDFNQKATSIKNKLNALN